MGTRRAALLVALVASLLMPAGRALAAYPPAGLDSFDSTAMVFIAPGPDCMLKAAAQTVTLSGPTTIRRENPKPVDGKMRIDTEMLQLDLTGTSPLGTVTIRQDPARPTKGAVTQKTKDKDFPAESFFDVFVEVDVAGTTYTNLEPAHMAAEIWSLPPHALPYLPPENTCIPLAVKGTGVPVLSLIHATHTPKTIRDCFPAQSGFWIVDTQTGETLNAKNAPALAEFVHGTLPKDQRHIDTELIALDLQGTAVARGQQVSIHAHERADTGSFGRYTPGGDSFFDVFTELSVGDTSPQVQEIHLQGSYDPETGGTFSGGGHPVEGQRYFVQGAFLSLGAAAPCPNDNPPQ